MAAGPGGGDVVENDETLFRRLPDPGITGTKFVVIDAQTGLPRPTSAAFSPTVDGVSVYRQGVLAEHGMDASHCATATAGEVVGFQTGEVREVGTLDVVPDAWPPDVEDPGQMRNAAHALIIGWDLMGKRDRDRARRALAKLPSMTWAHP